MSSRPFEQNHACSSAFAAGYLDADAGLLPQGALNDCLGCGNPLSLAALRPGDKVLDLGCGAGIDLLLAAKRVGPEGKVIGIDISTPTILQAQAHIAQSGSSNIDLLQGDIEKLPLVSQCMDYVISNCVISLSKNKRQVFAEIARVLQPGGKILLCDVVRQALPLELTSQPSFQSSCLKEALDETTYIQCLKESGLMEVVIKEHLDFTAKKIAALIWPLSTITRQTTQQMQSLVGKVATIKIAARKPDW